MANILVVCTPIFNGEEMWVVLGSLKRRGHKAVLASSTEFVSDEDTYERIKVHKLLAEVPTYDTSLYEGIIVITGPPKETREFWYNEHILQLLKEADDAHHAIGAICVGVATVRHVAKGRQVSHWPRQIVKELLVNAGAIPSGLTMTRDGNLVTAEFQPAAKMWMQEFCNVVEGKPKEFHLQKSGMERSRGKPRKSIPIVDQIKKAQEGNGKDADYRSQA